MVEHELLSLTQAEVAALNYGVNIVKLVGKNTALVHKAADGTLRACENLCKHQGGTFAQDIEDVKSCVVTCTRHQWKLDVSAMEYVNPPKMHRQAELVVRRHQGNGIKLIKEEMLKAWDDVQEYLPITMGELTVTYMTHACMEIKMGDKTIITDPWLLGPAFMRGWWLSHKPPADVWERLMSCDAIWISHSHTDHLNLPTMTELAKRRIDVPIYVGDLRKPVIRSDIKLLGFTNITVVPIETWVTLGEGRFMINDDDTMPDVDAWLLLEYKGHRICNFVDCSAPSAFQLPSKQVDLILTDFASGASGFPSCFADLHGNAKVEKIAHAKRAAFLRKIKDLADKTNAKAYVPVAGYFVASHPNDADVKRLNKQNTPDDAIYYINKVKPGVITWKPFPGAAFDVSTMSGPEFPGEEAFLLKHWDHDTYVKPLEHLGQRCLATLEEVQLYFRWAGFHSYDLMLHVREMDDKLIKTKREFWVDFAGDTAVVLQEKPREGNIFSMRVRSSSFRVVCFNGSSWDDIMIGFQGRFNVIPDMYHLKFLNHFANTLPVSCPNLPLIDARQTIGSQKNILLFTTCFIAFAAILVPWILL